ncbi:hypothetical protein RhiirA5_368008 [Rhizophagus irregularis]|uniref:Uncharacterized protein n=1 Tax=Rhizophagus irregularis TaxID=588596 RepID=A0A2N0NLX3_9GLOM|nr:hypothetical protein RhiirA5_368008 [Rhizophagus irregularis]
MHSTCTNHAHRKDMLLSIHRLEFEHRAFQHSLIGNFESINGNKGKLLVVV